MKLFTQYNRINILATVATFILGSIAFYFLLSYILNRQLDETLRSEQQEITEYVAAHNKLPDFQNTRHQWFSAAPATAPLNHVCIKNIKSYNKREQEDETTRQLAFTIKADNVLYVIYVNRSEAETEDLLKLIIMLALGMIGVVLAFNYFVNRRLVNHLWKPFYNTVAGIKNYFVAFGKPMQLPAEPIDEINLLNESLNEMTARIYREYQALKSFTENASHEMQTPLAVIKSKIELLLQNDLLKESEIKNLLAIESASNKLARLYQSLLLLTKIENRQFSTDEMVDVQKVIEDKLTELEDVITSRGLIVHASCHKVLIALHPHLAEILVNNLLNNAIRYSPPAGAINIELNAGHLRIANTAAAGPLDTGKVFMRFYKTQNGLEGTGLGLAIVKEICNAAGLDISYRFEDNAHIFVIYFDKKTSL